jgi:hypothetical protein
MVFFNEKTVKTYKCNRLLGIGVIEEGSVFYLPRGDIEDCQGMDDLRRSTGSGAVLIALIMNLVTFSMRQHGRLTDRRPNGLIYGKLSQSGPKETKGDLNG